MTSAAPAPRPCDEAAVRIWGPAVRAAAKGKLLPPREAEELAALPDVDGLDQACSAIQTWCWLRGLPPLDRIIALERERDPVRPVVDWDVYFEAMGRDVHTLRFVLAYPWPKVREPRPEDLARAASLVAGHAAALRAFRFLDLELDLREADAARGRRRPVPDKHASWAAVEVAHAATVQGLAGLGLTLADVRPPGLAPYPPLRPRD